VRGLRYPVDTGAYKCTAQNDAGSGQDIATVFVQQQADGTSSVTGVWSYTDRLSYSIQGGPKNWHHCYTP